MLIGLLSIGYTNVKRLTPPNVKEIAPKLADYHAKNPTKPLKAEAPAAGATLQRLRGRAAAKNQNDLHICVLRRYFLLDNQLHHRERENATEAALHANNGIFGRDNAGDYFSLANDRKYL